jgi:hypothetical protein
MFQQPPFLVLALDLQNYVFSLLVSPLRGGSLKTLTTLVGYTNGSIQTNTEQFNSQNSFIESNANIRYQRNLNPIFRYDYKLGNYFTKEDSIVTPYLFTTINELTGGIRKSS